MAGKVAARSDVKIRILPGDPGRSRLLLTTPTGEKTAHFEAPCNPAQLEQILAGGFDADAARDFGRRLFAAVFPHDLFHLYEKHHEALRGQSGRLLIKIDADCPEQAFLRSLPWEFLYCPKWQSFLSLHRTSSVVRFLEVPEARPLPPPIAANQTLRVLVMMSCPQGVSALELEREQREIAAVWQRQADVEVVFLEREAASLAALRSKLGSREFHVLHFMGHGVYNERSGEGQLLLTAADGTELRIPGNRLAEKLRDFDSLRLVVLNACETARTGYEEEQNPFAGVAQALILGGVPAVIAMQFPVTDVAAIAFSEAFYHHLAAGEPIDLALAEGRQKIHSDGDLDAADWAAPVLYTSVPEFTFMERRRPAVQQRWLGWLAAAMVVALAGFALWPIGDAEVDFDLQVEGLTFTLAEEVPVIERFALSELGVADLSRIEFPHAWKRPSLQAERRGLRLRLAGVGDAAGATPVSLNQARLPAGSRLEFVHQRGRQLQLVIDLPGEAGAEPASVAPFVLTAVVGGPVTLDVPQHARERFDDQRGSLKLVPHRLPLTLELAFASFDGDELADLLPVRDLEFLAEEEDADLTATHARWESTVEAGSVRLVGSERTWTLQRNDVLRTTHLRGELYKLKLHDDHIEVGFHGRVAGLTAQSPSAEPRDLMPDRLTTWQAAAWQQVLALVAALAGVGATLWHFHGSWSPIWRWFRLATGHPPAAAK